MAPDDAGRPGCTQASVVMHWWLLLRFVKRREKQSDSAGRQGGWLTLGLPEHGGDGCPHQAESVLTQELHEPGNALVTWSGPPRSIRSERGRRGEWREEKTRGGDRRPSRHSRAHTHPGVLMLTGHRQ